MKRVLTGILWCLAIGMVYSVLIRQSGQGERMEGISTVFYHRIKPTMENSSFVVIDSGHGFFDAGKIGVGGTQEKKINLVIAQKLRDMLELQGIHVRMTRENDEVLYDGEPPEDKKEDMRKRVALMNERGCLLAVSIHQNSFTEEKYKGAQVFYYKPSEESHRLASAIQQSLIEFQNSENTRQEKANEDYYILRKERVPTVICECGFLSNPEEEVLLCTEAYQEKTAWAISVGILRYLNEKQVPSENH